MDNAVYVLTSVFGQRADASMYVFVKFDDRNSVVLKHKNDCRSFSDIKTFTSVDAAAEYRDTRRALRGYEIYAVQSVCNLEFIKAIRAEDLFNGKN